MTRRVFSETGFYHVTTRSAGQIALFEDDADRRFYLRTLREARDRIGGRVIAWVLMTDHVHLILDFGDSPLLVSSFMHHVNERYSKHFNNKTARVGRLFQSAFWSKPINTDAQLIATVHYVHMNPETAGISPMRTYRWSSYQEYAGKHWVVDTSVILKLFGSFESFDTYSGSPKDVVSRTSDLAPQDGDVLRRAIELANVKSSNELRSLSIADRNDVIRQLASERASTRKIARTFGIGATTVRRAIKG